MKMICRSMEQGGVRAGPSCSCVLGFAGAPDSLVLLLGLWVLEAWSSANPGPVLGDSVWVSGLQSPAPVSQLPGRDPRAPRLPRSPWQEHRDGER